MSNLYPRLVACDLDGTLLRDDKTVSPRTLAIIRQVEKLAIPFVIITGRPPRTVIPACDLLDIHGIVVCQNGALIYDVGRDEILSSEIVPAGAAHAFVLALRERAEGIAFACEVERLFGCELNYEKMWPHKITGGLWRADALDLCAASPTKLLALHPTLSADALLALAREIAGDSLEVTHSGLSLIEITAPGIDKASGSRWICARHGIDAGDVVAFGDMPIDVPLLRWAGRGIAVANAHPEALAVADEITLSNNEDGVAVALEAMLAGSL